MFSLGDASPGTCCSPLPPLFSGRLSEIKDDIRFRLSHTAVSRFEIRMELWVGIEPPESVLRQDEIPGAFRSTTLQFADYVLAIRRVLSMKKTYLRKVPAFPPAVLEE